MHQHLVFDGHGSLEQQVADRTDEELRDRARQNARRALRAGITTIRDLGDRNFVTLEHCTFFTANGRSEPDDGVLERIASSGTPVSATWGGDPAHPPLPLVEANRPAVDGAMPRLRSLGGTVVVGTDAGVSAGRPHDVLPHAARDLAAIGLDADEVLTTLTATAADVCGVGHRKGRLAPGWRRPAERHGRAAVGASRLARWEACGAVAARPPLCGH